MIRFRELILILLLCSLHLLCLGSDPTFSKLSLENGLSNNLINEIYKDSYGFIWFGTLEGLDLVNTTNLKAEHINFNDLQNKKTMDITGILPDNHGNCWLSTLSGLVRYSLATKKSDLFLFKSIPEDACNSFTAICIIQNKIYLGTSNQGIVEFDLSTKTFSSGINTANKIILSISSDKKEWLNNGNGNTVYYEKLSPGNYVFRVRNANDQDINSSNNLSIQVTIHHYWVKSPFFIAFIVLLLLAGTYLIVKYIQKLQREGKRDDIPQKLEKYRGIKIPEDESARIIAELKRYMEEKEPYLNAEFKLGYLASEINYPLHEISQILNQGLNQSFPDFVNKYRVNEVIKRMKDKAYARFTFFAIAQQCGFNSKTSFYRIFKNETGKTPADFIKEL